MKRSLIVLMALISGCAEHPTITTLTDHDYKIDGKLYKADYEKNYKTLQLHMLGKRPYSEKGND